jgi:hypothetical protein
MIKAYYVEGISESYRTPMVLAESPREAAEIYFKSWVDPTHFESETPTSATYRYNISAAFYDPQNPDEPLDEDWQFITFQQTDCKIFTVNLN